MEKILTQNEIRVVAAAASAATTAVESSVVDTAGCHSVLFFATIGTANAGNYISVAQGTDATVTDAADLAGSKVVAAANGDIVAVEIFHPAERYLKATITRGASTTTGDLYCIRKVKDLPAANNVTSEIVSEIKLTPAEGTI